MRSPSRVAVFVVDGLEAVHVEHDEICRGPVRGRLQAGHQALAGLEEGASRHGAGERVRARFIVHIGGVAAVEDEENDHQGHQREDADEELHL